MSTSIIFSCNIPNETRLFVLEEYINCFIDYFKECDFYIGIGICNKELKNKIVNVLLKSNLNIYYDFVNINLYDYSDAAGYQLALKILKKNKKVYNYCWFIHTKGAYHTYSDYLRTWYINNLLKERINIENFLNNNVGIGSYGLLGLNYNNNINYKEEDVELPLIKNNLNNIHFKYSRHSYFYIHTNYVIIGSIVNKFLNIITDKWFETKLNKYYFEGVFPFIVSRLGYFPYILNTIDLNGEDINQNINKWITDNNLLQYKKYINYENNNFIFNQLRPKNVNNNTQS